MRGIHRTAWRLVRWALPLGLLVMCAGLLPGIAEGPPEEPVPAYGEEVLAGAALTGYDDGGSWEVGVHCSGGNLAAYAWSEGVYLRNKLVSGGWVNRYIYNDTWAWEEDFKRQGASGGGKEHLYVDTVDLQFYVGHGSPSSFTFANTSHDDKWLTSSDCYRSWGDGDNDWVALTSCQVLGDSNLSGWARCFKGTHLILGFKTNAAARTGTSTQGYRFAKYLTWPYNYRVAQAWYKAGDVSQPSGRIVRALINELTYLNDRPGTGSVTGWDSTDTDAWVQTHTCGSEPARQVDVAALNGEMPVYRTQPLNLAEAEAQYDHLGDVFGVPVGQTRTLLSEDGNAIWHSQSDGHDLEMDPSGGLYGYLDLNNLWTYTDTVQAYSLQSGQRLTADDARARADSFLTDNNLMSSGAQFYEVVSDTISGGPLDTSTAASMQASLLQDETPLVYQVIYSRILTYTAPGPTGKSEDPLEFSVVGPGAKQKVYVPLEDNQLDKLARPVLGAQGGWRQLQQPGANLQANGGVPMLTPAQIYALYMGLGNRVTLNNIPILADAREILSHTVAYWEEAAGVSQAQLTPVYQLTVRFSLEGQEVATDYAYVPVNEGYMRPYAEIVSAPAARLGVGQVATFTAADASNTVNDLGYTGPLGFTLGSGDTEEYLYFWYENSVEDDNLIASGLYASAGTISHTVNVDLDWRDGTAQQRVILKVVDNGTGLSSEDSATLDVVPPIFLPALVKD